MEHLNRDRSFVWTVEKTKKLISMYKSYPCLFNTKTIEYKDKIMRQEVWQHMARQLETTKGEIIKKVRGLRTQFAREKAKKAARSRLGEHVNSWTYYDSLLFLDEFVTPRNKSLNDWSFDYNQVPEELVEGLGEEADDTENSNDHPFAQHAQHQLCEIAEQVKYEPEEADDCLIVSAATASQPKQMPKLTGIVQNNPYSSMLHDVKSQVNKRKRPRPTSSTIQLQHQTNNTFQLPSASRKDSSSELPTSSRNQKPVQNLQITSYSTTAREEPQSPPVSSTNEPHEEIRANSGEDDDIFAKYITSELRQIKDPHVKRIVKHKIQNIIFEAHCSLHK